MTVWMAEEFRQESIFLKKCDSCVILPKKYSYDKGFYFENKTNDNVPWDCEGTIVGELLKEFMNK
jgi:hypothetical protein